MKAVIIKELRERRISLIAYCLAVIGFIWLYVSLFPFIHNQSQSYNTLLESFPKGFSDAFGIDANFLANVQGYLAGEMFSLIWPLLAIILVVSRAGSTIAGEIEKGTMGTLLSQPMSRIRLFLAKYLAGVSSYAIFVVASVFISIPLAYIYKVSFWTQNYFTLAIVSFLFGMAVYSFAIFLSAFSNEKSHVYSITGGILFIMYVLNIVSGLKSNLHSLQYASVFHYYNASEALVYNHLNWISCVVFISAIIIFSILGLFIFNKRDISI